MRPALSALGGRCVFAAMAPPYSSWHGGMVAGLFASKRTYAVAENLPDL
jgi:hypothetical protein